ADLIAYLEQATKG
nr:Chain E, MCC-p5E peptide [Mus musculus]